MPMQSSMNKPVLRLLARLFSGLLSFLLLWPLPLNAGDTSASRGDRHKAGASTKLKASKKRIG